VPHRERRTILITGGAGFIGSNLAERLLRQPDTSVTIFDNLARAGVSYNLEWLQTLPQSSRLTFVHGDVRDANAVMQAVRHATEIYHLAAQVAVTTSITAPREDMEVNMLGTFNVLEAARRSGRRPLLLFTSTNKVYGSLDRIPTRAAATRYHAMTPDFQGVDETELLDFHSPYGCSKGAADQYVRDYARMYGLNTVVFRMSCIAGPRQFGTEDQGWVAHFLYSVLEGRPITIYGDGLQVRDILHVSDLIDAMEYATASAGDIAGEVFNIGGGLLHAISVREMLSTIAELTGRVPVLHYSATRAGDQPLYISNTAKLEKRTGWSAHQSISMVLRDIHQFWCSNRELLASHRGPVFQQTSVAEEVA
jgi:CDP-paratose 2-epimerase